MARHKPLTASVFERLGEWIQLGHFECCNCKRKTGVKVIAAGLPLKFCVDERCSTLWGEPWATLYTYIFAPIEARINGGFCFTQYEGAYLKALWRWMFPEKCPVHGDE